MQREQRRPLRRGGRGRAYATGCGRWTRRRDCLGDSARTCGVSPACVPVVLLCYVRMNTNATGRRVEAGRAQRRHPAHHVRLLSGAGGVPLLALRATGLSRPRHHLPRLRLSLLLRTRNGRAGR